MTSSYQGEWKDNRKEGFGTQTSSDGTKYEGEWASGKRHGRGTLWVRKDGEMWKRYAGDWVMGKRHGFGVFFFDNGDRYEGEFVQGKRNGQGTMVYADGAVYEGAWEAGRRSGIGVLTTSSGDAYEGQWMDDEKHGPGRLFNRSTRKMYEGEWVHGTPKCGVLSSIPGADEDGEDDDFVLPELELRDPDAVIMEAVDAARRAAAAATGDDKAGGGAEAGAPEGEAPVPMMMMMEDGMEDGLEDVGGGAWAAQSLTEEEVEELWHAFVAAPGGVTEDRCMSAADLGPVLEALGLSPTEEDLARILGLAGVSPGGVLPFDSFAAVMASLRQ